ncbi:hypothetical protein V1281_003133 [Nitrobacteraceae bacterium AZCC 2161]
MFYKQDGSDREQRDSARASYEENIGKSTVQGSADIWQRVRDRWGQGIHTGGSRIDAANASELFDKYNDKKHDQRAYL